MLTPTGFVTDAYLMLDMRNHWTSYYKWLQNGRWSWLVLARQFVRLILRTVKGDSGGVIALPLLSRLIPSAGNTGKLVATNTLIRGVYRLLQGVKVRVLVDSWFMRRCFIESMEQRGFDVIGQVRRDTRLYEEPPKRKRGQRGRPRKYGEKYTPKRIAHFKRTEATLQLYGRSQDVHYRSKIAKARFLNGRLVMAVWCEFKSDNGRWKQTCLLIST
ncbi:MAG: transposase, partial [Gammaproteobacteria bacterium]|nr:transposase [Gammaproteobacteria bacterium]